MELVVVQRRTKRSDQKYSMAPYVGMANGEGQLKLGRLHEVMHSRERKCRGEFLVSPSNTSTRGHQMKLIGGRSETA